MNSKLSPEQLRSLSGSGAALLQMAKLENARRSLIPFTTYTFPGYRVNWHHRLIAKKLEELYRGDIRRLIITTPPRHGKSELMSRRFPAWALGQDPDEQVIACSYNADTASDFNRDVQRIIVTPAYKRLFPGTLLSERNVVTVAQSRYLRNSKVFECAGSRGGYRSSGVGGGITGQGATIGLIDDPIKNHEEAFSSTYREKLWNWYVSTFLTRGEGKFARGGDVRIAVTVTRWHEDDLVGRLLERIVEDSDEEWHVVDLPAILNREPSEGDPRKEGEALWPEKYTARKLLSLKKSVGPQTWNSLYQQSPAAAEGGMFKRKWWGSFEWDKLPRLATVWTSWDLSVKGASADKKKKRSFNVGLVMGKAGGKTYILDCVRFQGEFTEQIVRFKVLSAKWPQAMAHVVEAKANGPALISMLREHIPGIIPWDPDTRAKRPGEKIRMGTSGKEARASAVTPTCASGAVSLPKDAPWRQSFEDELASFPAGKYDDQVDAFTQGLQYGHRNAIAIYEQIGIGQ